MRKVIAFIDASYGEATAQQCELFSRVAGKCALIPINVHTMEDKTFKLVQRLSDLFEGAAVVDAVYIGLESPPPMKVLEAIHGLGNAGQRIQQHHITSPKQIGLALGLS